jgi:multiple sugar transport system ATP-binding protein
MIAGLEEISQGEILIGDVNVTKVEPARRGVAMVFQSYALYPHMTVRDNIGFSLRMAGRTGLEIEKRTTRAANMLQLESLLERKPSQLSGGQRQRVAIGRAIVREPKVFLFDEPLSNLDAALRVQMRAEIATLHSDIGATMIYVTHDQVEAMTMADKIVVLNGGRIEQVGAPLELYHRPKNLFVAGFIGSPKINLLKTEALPLPDGRISVALPGGETLALPSQAGRLTGRRPVTLGVRPEHLVFGAESGTSLVGTLKFAERLGSETMLFLTLQDGQALTVRAGGLAHAAIGSTLHIGIQERACHLFDEQGDVILNGDMSA